MFSPVSILCVPNLKPTYDRHPLNSSRLRVDLHESLKRLATDPSRPGNPATIRVASKVLSCDCDSGVVTLENGETIQGDLVIGADGMYVSAVLSGETTSLTDR
jgi:2-polyprenyl-6-methoxyphenol hydroxylase-like FAD-dependent oxidoreductase